MRRILLSSNKRTSLTCNFALRVVVTIKLIANFVCVRESKGLSILRTKNTGLFLFYILRAEWVLANAYGCLLDNVVGLVGVELSCLRSNRFFLALNTIVFVCRSNCDITKITFWMSIPYCRTILFKCYIFHSLPLWRVKTQVR
jgi:hypothetical protein